ncbi:MAG: hypothetical protein H0X24_02195 [Ktedonobacterales bacterium]|nr:hypothetical protein [Ktedonobacterales bacterium]
MPLRWHQTFAKALCLGIALMLLGCGVSSNQSGGGNSFPPIPKKTPNPSFPARGCSDAQPPADLGTPAVVLVPASQPVAATVQAGAVIQIHFSPNYRWSAEELGGLTLIDPAGYFDAAHNACVWNLRANATGMHQLQFTGDPVATGTMTTTSRSLIVGFAITVTA